MNRPIATALVLLLTGCSMSASSGQLADVRVGYNEAIARSNNEQLLLNVVRLRYLHAPQFFEVASVTTQSAITTSGSASVTGNLGNNINDGSIFTPFVTPMIGGDVSVEDRPTVQYSPLQGEAFAQRMVTPIRPDTLLQLVEVGWRIDRLLTACVQRINDLPAPVIASGDDSFGGAGFREVAELLYELQIHQSLEVSVMGSGDERHLVLGIVPPAGDAHLQDIAAEVRERLGLADRRVFTVVGSHVELEPAEVAAPAPSPAPPAEEADATEETEDEGEAEPAVAAPAAAPAAAPPEAGSDRIVLRGRSLLGALFYLSHGVEVPDGDATARSLDYRNVDGDDVHVPQPLPGALLNIRVTQNIPVDSFVVTRYRGRFYSISDRDLRSKANLLLLGVLFSVLSSSNSGAPVLTIPLGG